MPGVVKISTKLKAMSQKEIGMQMVIDAQEDLIKNLEKELRKAKRDALRLRLSLQVLIGTPTCNTAENIKEKYAVTADFSNSILHYN